MKRIIIDVDDATARMWKYASTEMRQKLAEKVKQIMKTALNKGEDDFWPFLEKLRKNAETKGFSDDILNQVLSEE
jgi:hypothetical protein